MSVSHTSHYTPRSSASQGRIVTANSTLSAQLRDDSEGVVVPASRDLSANTHALNVVSSDLSVVNSSPSTTNTAERDTVEYVVVSKSRLSLNTNTELDNRISKNTVSHHTSNPDQASVDLTNQCTTSAVSEQPYAQETNSVEDYSKGELSNRYSYYSLKCSGDVSRLNTNSNALINQSQQQAGLNGDGTNSIYGAKANLQTENSYLQTNSENEINAKSASILRSQYTTESPNKDIRGHREKIAQAKNNSGTPQSRQHTREHSLNAQQHTHLSLYSQQERIAQVREPHSVDVNDQSVPPLDLSRLSSRKSPVSDSKSDPLSLSPKTDSQTFQNNNLHASVKKSPLVHFTPHDYDRTARTYEVETPYISSQLPHVNSSDNFSGPPDTYRDTREPIPLDKDTFRQREDDRQSKVGSLHSDLADDLKLPYQFDTQAQEAQQSSNYDKPPSPPIPISPPPEREPATSLRSNSQVYAVANPEILKAQGIDPPPNNHFTPRQYSNTQRQGEPGVRFNSASKRQSNSRGQNSPVKDRAPTPYNRSAPDDYGPRSPARDQQHQNKPGSRNTQGLPPQHPPLDTKHSHSTSAKTEHRQEARNKLDDSASVKRVYVESPTFTKEEEEEYRFVSSRIEDTEEKDQATFREMDRNKRGYADRDNERNNYDRNREREDYYSRKQVDQDRYNNQHGDRDRYDDRYEDRNRERYEDRNHDMNGYGDDRHRDMYRDNGRNGQNNFRDNDRYEDRNKYDPYNSQEKYERLKDERSRYEHEPYREEDPDFRQGYRKQNTELDAQELQKEQEYQLELKKRIDKQKIKETDYLPPHERVSYDRNNFARDSLEYPNEGEKGFVRDSLEYNNYGNQGQGWRDPPQNPYQEKQDQYYENEYDNPQFVKEDSKPAFYDAEDAARMEVVNPTQPKYDYVNLNKQDFGVPAKRSYRDIVHKKKEEEEKLDKIFIHPKVPSKQGKKKKAQSAQPEHMGYQAPVQDQYPLGFKPSSAEELWAMRSHTLQNQSAGSKKGKGSASKLGTKKWNSNPNIKHNHTYQAPPPLPSQGQSFKPPNMNYPNSPMGSSSQGGFNTPTRPLQPIENKPAAPISTEFVPTALEPNSPFRRHMELKPITQEIVTDDGQRISVDINLRLVSPPPAQGNNSPTAQQQQQLALIPVPVQETQGPSDPNQMRPVGVPYTLQDQYGYDQGYQTYQEVSHLTLYKTFPSFNMPKTEAFTHIVFYPS